MFELWSETAQGAVGGAMYPGGLQWLEDGRGFKENREDAGTLWSRRWALSSISLCILLFLLGQWIGMRCKKDCKRLFQYVAVTWEMPVSCSDLCLGHQSPPVRRATSVSNKCFVNTCRLHGRVFPQDQTLVDQHVGRAKGIALHVSVKMLMQPLLRRLLDLL